MYRLPCSSFPAEGFLEDKAAKGEGKKKKKRRGGEGNGKRNAAPLPSGFVREDPQRHLGQRMKGAAGGEEGRERRQETGRSLV